MSILSGKSGERIRSLVLSFLPNANAGGNRAAVKTKKADLGKQILSLSLIALLLLSAVLVPSTTIVYGMMLSQELEEIERIRELLQLEEIPLSTAIQEDSNHTIDPELTSTSLEGALKQLIELEVQEQQQSQSSVVDSDPTQSLDTYEDKLQTTTKIPFIENQGQASKEVRFYADTFAGTVFVTDYDLTYALGGSTSGENSQGIAIKENFVGSNGLEPIGLEKSESVINYFVGEEEDWRSNVSSYNIVSLGAEVWPNIGIELKAAGDNVEKVFKIAPSGNADDIRLSFDGIRGLFVNQSGELMLETDLGYVAMTKPDAFQVISDQRISVPVSYYVDGNEYGFVVSEYNPSYELIIDPLLASTFIGGSSGDISNAIAIDSSGSIFIAGETSSTSNYPTTVGAYDTSVNGLNDIFISKFSNDLSTLSASTYIGGSNSEFLKGIAIDSSDNIFVTGWTESTTYPTTTGAYDTTHNGANDVYVSKLTNTLSTLSASTFIGGSGSDLVEAIALDSSNNIFVAGIAGTGYPTTAGAYDTSLNGSEDIFISKLTNTLSTLSASTYIGGSMADGVDDITIDSADNVFIGGVANSADYPTTSGAYDTSHSVSSADAFISKFTNTLSTLSASTFIGGSAIDSIAALTFDSSNNIFATGRTDSTDYPTTSGAYDTSSVSGTNVFISKLTNTLSTLSASTYIGDGGFHIANAIAVDSLNNIFVAGRTNSAAYPTTTGAYDSSHNGGTDAFISKLTNTLSTLSASTFVGGSSSDIVNAIAIDSSDNIFVTGQTSSANYPTTAGAYDTSHNGSTDAFISEFSADLADSTPPTGTLSINSGAAFTTSTEVILNLTCEDTGSGCERITITWDNVDANANSGTADIIQDIRVTSDSDAVGVEFDADETAANTGVFELDVLLTNSVESGRLSVQAGDSITVHDFPLSSNDGTKTVSASFTDMADNTSPSVSDSIILDTIPPSAPVITSPADGASTSDNTPTIEGTVAANLLSKFGSSGTGDGQFNFPNGLAIDSDGNLYVADGNNHRIQKFDSSGNFLLKWGTFCRIGDNTGCVDPDGAGPLQLGDGQFNLPIATAMDSDGNLYVVERDNHRIQKFTSSGTFITKWGSFGTGDGQFSSPLGIVIDSTDNVYVSDRLDRVQKFTSSGTFITKWGSFGSDDGQFNDPSGMAKDSADNLYVADLGNGRVQKFDTTGGFITSWASSEPMDVAVDSADNVYVVGGNRVQKFDTTGGFITSWGSAGFGDGQFDLPFGIEADYAGNIYVSDRLNNRVQKFEPSSGDATVQIFDGSTLIGSFTTVPSATWSFTPSTPLADGTHMLTAKVTDATGNESPTSNAVDVTIDTTAPQAPVITSPADGTVTNNNMPTIEGTVAANLLLKFGSIGSANGEFNLPYDLAVDPNTGNVYITDQANNRVQKFDSSGNFMDTWGAAGNGNGEFNGPHGIALDPNGTRIYVADQLNHRIQKFNSAGNHLLSWGTAGSGDGEFNNALGIAVDTSTGHVYVADTGNHRIQKFDSSGQHLLSWGISGSGTGEFLNPEAVDVDSSGNVYVADTNNNRVQQFTSIGTFIAEFGTAGSGDGQFNAPRGLAINLATGDVYVSDTGNNRVQQLSSAGDFIAKWGTFGTADGQFNGLRGLAADANGNIYVADYENHRIQKFEANSGNAMVEVFDGTTSLGTLNVPASSTWSFTPSATLAEGTHTFTAKVTDTAGNTSPDSNSVTLTVDTVAPVTAASPAGGTFSTPQSVTLTADDPSATIYYTTDGTNPNTFSTVYSGAISITRPTVLKFFAVDTANNPEAVKTVTFKFTTASVQSATGAGAVTFSTNAGAFSRLDPVAEGDLATTSGKPTDQTFPFGFFSFTIDGIAAGQTVTVTMAFPSGISTTFEYWKVPDQESFNQCLIFHSPELCPASWLDATSLITSNDGDQTMILTITDGGTGDLDSAPNGKIFDPGGVGLPTISAPVITSPTDGTTTNDNTPTISGTADADSRIQVFDTTSPTILIGNALTDGTASWTVPYITNSFTVSKTPAETSAFFGQAVAASGDINGDGFSDLIVGVPFADNGATDNGEVHLFLGGPDGFDTIADAILTKTPAAASTRFGWSVASGDLNGDGIADVIVGEFNTNGIVHIFFGSSGTFDTTSDATLTRTPAESGTSFGISVAASDLNGDGIADAIVGASTADNGAADNGEVQIFFGGSTFDTTVDAILTKTPAEAGAQFGTAVTTGDLNGDGSQDVIVGVAGADNGAIDNGEAQVFFGGSGTFDTIADGIVTKTPAEADAFFGDEVASGDLNGDGFDDLIVGATFADNGATNGGEVQIFFGGPGAFDTTVDFTLTKPSAEADSRFARAIAVGDLNGDGSDDVIVGAHASDNGGVANSGEVDIFFGAIASSTFDSTVDIILTRTPAEAASFGGSVATGDLNKDGLDDLVVGVPAADTGATDTGEVELFISSRLADGSHSLTATAINADGVTSPESEAVTINVDTAPPTTDIPTTVSLNPLNDVPAGTRFTVSGILANELTGEELANNSISLDGSGIPLAPIIVTTQGVSITDPTGIQVISCATEPAETATCTPDFGREIDEDGANRIMRLHATSVIAVPDATLQAIISLQDMGDTTFTVRVTEGNGGTFDVESGGLSEYVALLDIMSPHGITQIEILSVQDDGTVGIASIQTLDPTSDPTVQLALDFEQLLSGEYSSPLALDEGSFFKTLTSQDTAASDLTVQAHFAGDETFAPSDSNVQTYSVLEPSWGGAGEPVGIVGDSGSGATTLDCSTSDPDTDGDGLCDSWESPTSVGDTTKGIPYKDAAGTQKYYNLCYVDPATGATVCPNKNHKDVFIEIDYMEFHRPDPAAITKVVDAFYAAPVSNPDGINGVNLHVLVDEELMHESSIEVWADSVADDNQDDFEDIKRSHRHFATSPTDATKNIFGTPKEEGDNNRLNAKTLAYRYGLFAHSIGECGPSGIAEVFGNDFIVSLGCDFDGIVEGHDGSVGSIDQQAGTLMHEIGHLLNLDHGAPRNLLPVFGTSAAGPQSNSISPGSTAATSHTATIDTVKVTTKGATSGLVIVKQTITLGKGVTLSATSLGTPTEVTAPGSGITVETVTVDVINVSTTSKRLVWKVEFSTTGAVSAVSVGKWSSTISLGSTSTTATIATWTGSPALDIAGLHITGIQTNGATSASGTSKTVTVENIRISTTGPTSGKLIVKQTVTVGTAQTITIGTPSKLTAAGSGLTLGTIKASITPGQLFSSTVHTLTLTIPYSTTTAINDVLIGKIGTPITLTVSQSASPSVATTSGSPTLFVEITSTDYLMNCEPNHGGTVMSYSGQFSNYLADAWIPGFGKTALSTLNEASLDENAGVGGTESMAILYGINTDPFYKLATSDTAIDWNNDGDSTDRGIAADINNLNIRGCGLASDGTASSVTNEVMKDYHEWNNLSFNYRLGAQAVDGRHADPHKVLEATAEVQEDIDSLAPTISIDLVSNSAPLPSETISVSGSVDEVLTTDKVTLYWQDGTTPTSGIPISSEGRWGPVEHTFSVSDIGRKDVYAELYSAPDPDGSSTLKATSTTIPVQVLAFPTQLSIGEVMDVVAGSFIVVSGQLTDLSTGEGISGMTITFSGSGAQGLSSAETNPEGFFFVTGASPAEVGTGWTVQAHFAGTVEFNIADSNIQTYDTLALPASALSLNPMNDVPSGTTFTVSGKLLATVTGEELSGRTVTIDGNGVPSGPVSAVTQGVMFTDASGIQIVECSSEPTTDVDGMPVSPVCTPDFGREIDDDGNNMVMHLHAESTITFPDTTKQVIIALQNMGDLAFSVEVTEGNGGIFTVDSFGNSLNVPLLDIVSPHGISQITIVSVENEDTVGIASIQTLDPFGDPALQHAIDFEDKQEGNYGAALTVNGGSFFYTDTSQNIAASGLTVQAHFAGDTSYSMSDSNLVTYSVLEASWGGAGEPTGIIGDAGNGVTTLDCSTSDPDTDGDGLCDSWESATSVSDTTKGIPYKDAAGTQKYYNLCYIDPATGSTVCPNKNHKDVFVEIDYMDFHRPDSAAITKVKDSFRNAPASNPDGINGVNLHVLVDEALSLLKADGTRSTHEESIDVWADPSDSPDNAEDDFEDIKRGHRHFTTSPIDGTKTIFGTPVESGDNNRLNTKTLAYRYGLSIHSIGPCGPSGIAEVFGNDFIVSLGCDFDVVDVPGHETPAGAAGVWSIGSIDQQAGTLMHEIGHLFNLDHGSPRSLLPVFGTSVASQTNSITPGGSTAATKHTAFFDAVKLTTKGATSGIIVVKQTVTLGTGVTLSAASLGAPTKVTEPGVAIGTITLDIFNVNTKSKTLIWKVPFSTSGAVSAVSVGKWSTEISLGTTSTTASIGTYPGSPTLDIAGSHITGSQLNGKSSASSTSKSITVENIRISTTGATSGKLIVKQTVTFGSAQTVTVGLPSKVTAAGGGLALGAIKASITPGVLFGTTVHTLTLTIPYTTTAAINDVLIGKISTPLTINPGQSADPTVATTSGSPTLFVDLTSADYLMNCEPNHAESVMPYSGQFSTYLGGLWSPDYGREALPTLNEANLIESDGIRSVAPSLDILYGIGIDPFYRTSASNTAIDWNNDGDSTDRGIAADINNLNIRGCGLASDGTASTVTNEVMKDHTEWNNLSYNYRLGSQAIDGRHADPRKLLEATAEVAHDIQDVTLYVSIDFVSNSAPSYGTTTFVSGSVNNAVDTDTVTVHWGDGSASTEGIPISSDATWGPVEHTYTSSDIGRVEIFAELHGSPVKATSTTIPIEVMRHATQLGISLTDASVDPNSIIQVTGRLTDKITGEPLGGQSITFSGSGSSSLPTSVTTESDGSFSATGMSPTEELTGWRIQAHFDGSTTTLYLPTDSNIVEYSTLQVFDYSIAATPASRTIAQGQPAAYDVSTTLLTGDSELVSLSVSGLPAEATATFTPDFVTPSESSVLFITTTETVQAGTHTLTITGLTSESGLAKTATVELVIAPITIRSFVTDAEFAEITSVDMVFTADKTTSSLKLTATNPGTYNFNKIIRNTGSSAITATFTLLVPPSSDPSLPVAFCLKGATPIHVYADLARTTDVTGKSTISPSQPISGATDTTLTCVSEIKVVTTIPAGELRFITVHEDFKGKGTTGYSSDAPLTYRQAFRLDDNVVIDGIPDKVEDLATLAAVGKRVTAIGGYALDSNLKAKSGLTVQMVSSSTTITTRTAADGFYFQEVPSSSYTVKIYNSGGKLLAKKSVSVSKDQYVQVDFLKLNPADPFIEGWVFDEKVQGIGGISINLIHDASDREVGSATTSSGGWYAFRFPEPGTYTVAIEMPDGYIASDGKTSETTSLKQFESARIDFNLEQLTEEEQVQEEAAPPEEEGDATLTNSTTTDTGSNSTDTGDGAEIGEQIEEEPAASLAVTITSPANGTITNDNTPMIIGSANPDSSIELSLADNAIMGTTQASSSGEWSFELSEQLADGSHTITAKYQDDASLSSSRVTILVDTIAPQTTASPAGGIYNSSQVVSLLSTESDVTIYYTLDGTTPAASANTPIYNGESIGIEQDTEFKFFAVDSAGNFEEPINSEIYTIDTTAPETPVITSPVDGETLSDSSVTIIGTAEPGSIVEVSSTDGEQKETIGSATADNETGSWSLSAELADGSYSLTATATDAAGNASPDSGQVSITIQTDASISEIENNDNSTSTDGGDETGEDTQATTFQLSGPFEWIHELNGYLFTIVTQLMVGERSESNETTNPVVDTTTIVDTELRKT